MDDNLRLGSKIVDDAHERLLEFFTLVNNDITEEGLLILLKEIYAYTLKHFEEEETFMRALGVPAEAIQDHKVIHARIKGGVAAIAGTVDGVSLLQKKQLVLDQRLILINHITVEDMKLKKYLRSIE